jgi:uncharacterized OB-fold protein
VGDQINRPIGMPDPVVAPINQGMWTAAAEGRLDVQRCADCGAHRYPPTDGCYRCASLRWDWSTLPGTGTIYSYIWVPDRVRAAADGHDVLYNVAIVTLDGTEGDPVRILSNVIDRWDVDDLRVGQVVEFVPVAFGSGLAMPCFRTAG